MKSKKYLFFTLKKKLKTKNNIHNLLIQSGIIRKLCSGLYSWLPTGIRILNKIKLLLRIKMSKLNAFEINMPILQPIKLWNINNKINLLKSELISTFDKSFILSPTNEEMITYIIKNEILFLYNKLPITLFQIQNKFRNEIRPFGTIIRTKEFIMKDAYSFHKNNYSLDIEYKKFKKCYSEIFNELNINHFILKTKSNLIKCRVSHEFHVESKYGNNNIIICNKTNKVEFLKNSYKIFNKYRLTPKENFKIIDYKYLSNKYILDKKILKDKLLKVVVFYSNYKKLKSKFIGLVMRYYDFICIKKLKNIDKIQFPFKIITNNDIIEIFGCPIEFIGILNLNIPIIVDYNAILISDFITSFNINKKFAFGVNWDKNIKVLEIVDVSYKKHKNLSIKKSIEIAHIFKLNDIYTKKLNIKKKILMGCYGIGLSRIMFSLFEKNYKKELILPYNISPFSIAILPINMKNSNLVKSISKKIYIKLISNNFDVILDDRVNKSFGYIINDLILLGIPIILIINENNLKFNLIEVKNRYKNQNFTININNIFKYLNKEING